MNEDILEYQGTFYTLSETRMPFKADKTVDEDYFILTLFAALITNGKAMPDGSGDKIPGNVIYQAAEDGIEDTIKPRLEAAGADCSRIAFLEQSDEEPILLNDARLAQAIEGIKAKLLVVDPLQAYLGVDSKIQRSNSARSVLENLAKVAERTGCAVVLIGHMNKSNRAKGIYRGLGSIDIAAVARSVLLVGRDRRTIMWAMNRTVCLRWRRSRKQQY